MNTWNEAPNIVAKQNVYWERSQQKQTNPSLSNNKGPVVRNFDVLLSLALIICWVDSRVLWDAKYRRPQVSSEFNCQSAIIFRETLLCEYAYHHHASYSISEIKSAAGMILDSVWGKLTRYIWITLNVEFFRGNISRRHLKMGWWWPGAVRSQGNISYGIELVLLEFVWPLHQSKLIVQNTSKRSWLLTHWGRARIYASVN